MHCTEFDTQLIKYPFKKNFFPRPAGGFMHYIDEGEGTPVLMVHGNPSWSYLYRNLILKLKDNYRCLAPDHLGMGLSTRPSLEEYGYKLEDRVEDLSAFINALNLNEPLHLICHDWGGAIASTWAVNNPQKVKSLTIMNSGLKKPLNYKMPWRLFLFKCLGSLGLKLAIKTNLFAWGTAKFGVVKKMSPQDFYGFLLPYLKSSQRLGISKFVEDIPLDNEGRTFEILKETNEKLSVLQEKKINLIWGLKDFVFTEEFFFALQNDFPKAKTLLLKDSGHYLLEDNLEKIYKFLHNSFSEGALNNE